MSDQTILTSTAGQVDDEPKAKLAQVQNDGGSALLDLYLKMFRVRVLNDEIIRMQRQGLVPAFAPCTGQEAAQVGSAVAIDTAVDFAFPTYREFGAMLTLGVSPLALVAHHAGYVDGGLFDPIAAHVAPMSAVVGGTALTAVGWAMGAALDGEQACSIAYFGDGASSQGEVHEAMNFASVFRAPVVFFCQNNRWAISVPVEKQVGGGSVAARAAGYGIPGVQVDGNDVEAVRDVTVSAVERARSGQGPTVIEAMTYRLGPHATSDDPRRYRSAEEEERWSQRDPITRTRLKLIEASLTTEALLADLERELEAETTQMRSDLLNLTKPSFADHLGRIYRDTPPQVREEDRQWLEVEANV